MKPIIPEAALSQHVAVLGKTGSGKTFAAKAAIVEPLLALGRRVGVVDPTGAWWGLRSSRDGKGAGFPILVLGGEHGDLPLPANGGEAVAKLLTEQGVNLVADTSSLTVGEAARWFIDFAGALYRLNRQPLHLVLDEAHNFAPQGKVPDPDTGKMLHAANRLASGGRSRGIRLVMITQRPQKLHKDALTSADTLIAMRVLAPHDREAVEDWIKGCGDREHGKEVLNSLASLQRGEGWVWYPEGHHLTRARFPQIRTFDSSATPEDGHAIAAPKAAAEVDLEEVKKALAAAVKEAEANDPKLLKKRIGELEAELRKKPAEVVTPASPKVEGLASVRAVAKREGYLMALQAIKPIAERLSVLGSSVQETTDGFLQDLQRLTAAAPKAAPQGIPTGEASAQPVTPARPAGAAAGGKPMAKSERQLLIVLAQRHPKAATRSQMSILSGYSGNSSTFDNALSGLRTKGYSQGYGDDNKITDAGLAALGSYEPLPSGQALVTWWLGKIGGGAPRAFLEYIVGRYPDAVSREELAGETGYSTNSSTFDNALSKLRTLELIERGEIRASEELFA